MRRIEPYFPLSHWVLRVDDRRVFSGILVVIRNGLTLARRSEGLWSGQNDLQSLQLLEPARGVTGEHVGERSSSRSAAGESCA